MLCFETSRFPCPVDRHLKYAADFARTFDSGGPGRSDERGFQQTQVVPREIEDFGQARDLRRRARSTLEKAQTGSS